MSLSFCDVDWIYYVFCRSKVDFCIIKWNQMLYYYKNLFFFGF